MELVNPKPKKFCKLSSNLPLPVILKKDNSISRIKGTFNGFSVCVDNIDDMQNIVSMGYFGKGNFSRNYPQFNREKNNLIRMRQYIKRTKWSETNMPKPTNFKKVITVPDSDDEYENYFINLTPIYQLDRSGIKEVVYLNLEEAFFLSNFVEVLDIYSNSNTLINAEESWRLFTEADLYFPYNYVVYHYFRCKNWVVKPGLKFGGDFLLYKQGPPFYHASYVIIVDVLNTDQERIQELTRRSMENVSLLCLNRLCETAGKELMICQVVFNKEQGINPTNLQNILIKEVLLNRFNTN